MSIASIELNHNLPAESTVNFKLLVNFGLVLSKPKLTSLSANLVYDTGILAKS